MESGARSRTGALPILTAARLISVALERRNATAPSATSAGSHSIPSPEQERGRLAARGSHAPHVAAIDIVLIGGKEHLAAIARERDVLDFEIARREKLRASAVGRNRIQMEPAVALPGEHQAIAVGPEDLVSRLDPAKRAAGTLFGVPGRAAGARGRIRYSNRPGSRGIAHRTNGDRGRVRPPHECDAAAVGTPDRRRVAVDARVQVGDGLVRDAVHADEAVIAAIAGERQRRSIGRPLQFIRRSLGVDGFRRLRVRVQRGHPDLAVLQKRDAAVARNGGSAAVAQFLGRTAIEGNRVDRLLRRLGKIPGIGDVAVGLEIAAAGIHQEASVGAPGEVAQVLAVVFLIRGEPAALVIRRGRDPEVARSAFIEDPGDFAPAGRGDELGREGARSGSVSMGSAPKTGPRRQTNRTARTVCPRADSRIVLGR